MRSAPCSRVTGRASAIRTMTARPGIRSPRLFRRSGNRWPVQNKIPVATRPVGGSPTNPMVTRPIERNKKLRLVRLGGRLSQSGKLIVFHEAQRFGVDAVALAGGARAVRKDVAQVRLTACAEDFAPHHAVAPIDGGDDILLGHGLKEAGPACAGIELRV